MIFAVILLLAQTGAPCATVDECRQQALAAESRQDYEAFHDLSWRAVQKGRPNDPTLMLMLARAMSLSGRPGDALVMLGRLVDMGVKVDASGDDFRRVRALKDWPELESRLSDSPPMAPYGSGAAAAATSPVPAPPPAPPKPAAAEPANTPEPAPARADVPDAPVTPEGEPFEFDAPPFEPAGLGYDEVSRRFVVGDRRAARLMVVDQTSHHVTPLVGAAAAGFYDTLTGFTIDHRRGDLWVVSSQGSGEAAESAVHKLQLVSGRVLQQVAATGGTRLVDVDVAADGTVYALDATGGRIVRLRPGTRALETVVTPGIDGCASLAIADEHVAYVGCGAGIVRVDLSSRTMSPVVVPGGQTHVAQLRAHGRSLFAVEDTGSGARLVRLGLNASGRSVSRVQALDSSIPATTALTVAGSTLYYVSGRGRIRAVELR